MKWKYLNSISVSRLHRATRTDKIEQLKGPLSWRQTKSKLKDLRRAGLLTFIGVKEHRLFMQWEPRVFTEGPEDEIKPEAKRTLEMVKYDLTLAFRNQQDREKFTRWLSRSGLLTKEPATRE